MTATYIITLIISSLLVFHFYSHCGYNLENNNGIQKDDNLKEQCQPIKNDGSTDDLNVSKIMSDINELNKLKEYISNLSLSDHFIDTCLKKIDSEIEIQKYSYFRKLGEITYKNSKEDTL